MCTDVLCNCWPLLNIHGIMGGNTTLYNGWQTVHVHRCFIQWLANSKCQQTFYTIAGQCSMSTNVLYNCWQTVSVHRCFIQGCQTVNVHGRFYTFYTMVYIQQMSMDVYYSCWQTENIHRCFIIQLFSQ